MSEPKHTLPVRLTTAQKSKLTEQAHERGWTMSHVVIAALESYVGSGWPQALEAPPRQALDRKSMPPEKLEELRAGDVQRQKRRRAKEVIATRARREAFEAFRQGLSTIRRVDDLAPGDLEPIEQLHANWRASVEMANVIAWRHMAKLRGSGELRSRDAPPEVAALYKLDLLREHQALIDDTRAALTREEAWGDDDEDAALEAMVKHAVDLVHAAVNSETDLWRRIREQHGQEGAREIFRLVRAGNWDPRAYRVEWQWALLEISRQAARENWAEHGFPIVVVSRRDAVVLAHTECLAQLVNSPHGTTPRDVLAIVVDDRVRLVLDWRTGASFEVDGSTTPALPLDTDHVRAFINNVGLALLERPVNMQISERRFQAETDDVRQQHPCGVAYVFGRVVDAGATGRTAPTRPSRTGSRGPIKVRTHVIGHNRMQAYGPRHSLRKPIWIAPTVRGPANAPVSVHGRRIRGRR